MKNKKDFLDKVLDIIGCIFGMFVSFMLFGHIFNVIF